MAFLLIDRSLKAVIVAAISLSIASALIVRAAPPLQTDNHSAANLDTLSTLLSLGEEEQVVDAANRHIADLRESVGFFDIQLAQPYLLLGEAQLALNQAQNAVDSFQSALHVLRVNHGLNSTEQLDALYRVSDAYVELNDFQKANESQERAYALMLNQEGINSPALLPSMLKLIDWYESNRRYRAAMILYIQAKDLTHSMFPADDKRHIELIRAFALGMRNASFPPLNTDDEFHSFEINIPGDPRPGWGAPIASSYRLGYGALETVVETLRKHANDDERELITAKLNLADWFQLFGRETKAIQLYREIWEDLDDMQDQRSKLFGEPKLLYIRLPEFRDYEKESGLVELLLTVSSRGVVTGRISQLVDPKDRAVEFRTRVAAKEARFRPAFRDGKPVTTKGVLLTHRYPLEASRGEFL